jgi:hypothetical protein
MKRLLPLLIVVSALLVGVIAYLLFFRPTPCDSIFEQTRAALGVKVEAIKGKGEVLAGPETIQALAESSQKVALHLKACCVARQTGGIDAEGFQACVKGAKEYESRIAQVTDTIGQVEAAKAQGNTVLASAKVDEAKRAANAAVDLASQLRPSTLVAAAKKPPAGAAVAGQIEYKVVSVSREGRQVVVQLYVINNGEKAIEVTDQYFRLLIADVPLAPGGAYAPLPPHGAKEVTLRFDAPFESKSTNAALQVGPAGTDETAKIPIELPSK